MQGDISDEAASTSRAASSSKNSKGASPEDASPASQAVPDPVPPLEYIFDFLPDRRKAQVLADANTAGNVCLKSPQML